MKSARTEAQPPQLPPPPPSEPPGPGRGPSRVSSRALPYALWSLRLGLFSSEPKDSTAEGRESALSRLSTSPSRLPLTQRSAGKRSQWPRDHPRSFPHRHPLSVADIARRPQHPTPAHLTSGGSDGDGHRKLLGARLRFSSTPLRLTPLVSLQNGAGGRALTSRPFPSPFPFHHSLPARGGRAPAPANDRTPPVAPAQSSTGARGFKPITHYHLQKSRKKPGSC